MKKFGVIFDCDGTLVDSLHQALISFNYALKEVTGRNYSVQEIKKFFGSSADRIFVSLLQNEVRATQAFEIYLDHQTTLAHEVRLHDGIREMLETFKKNEIPLAVVTGRHEKDLEIILGPHKISEYFITLIADNQLPKSKPSPEGILLACERMNLSPENTFYVGDSTMDIQAAHNAGARSIAALWDQLTHEAAMKDEKPFALARVPADVWSIYQNR